MAVAAGAPCGLSPRVRGSPGSYRAQVLDAGSIPACAGEPRDMQVGKRMGRVYPRVCGGASQLRDANIGRSGLSPRVRGSRGQ